MLALFCGSIIKKEPSANAKYLEKIAFTRKKKFQIWPWIVDGAFKFSGFFYKYSKQAADFINTETQGFPIKMWNAMSW